MAVVRSPDFLRALIRETALATLIHQRRLTPSCGGQAPTAERTVGPARMIAESLTPKPGIREHYRACIWFPVAHRRTIRTTNLLERLFVEERLRLKIMLNAFGERAVLKLMFGAQIRAAERWRSIKVIAFERRQLVAVKKELDQE